ncbi:MAG: GntR family transcriptional regulator [Oscillospiraceae bacterium]
MKKLLTKHINSDIVCIYRYTHYITHHIHLGGDSIKIMLNAVSDKPMYEQIKDAVRNAILNGELEENSMLPSVRQLAADLNVSAITTKRAYSDLEHEGLIYTSSGKGTFVKSPDKNIIMEQYRQRRLAEFAQSAEKLMNEGFTEEELINAVRNISERK